MAHQRFNRSHDQPGAGRQPKLNAEEQQKVQQYLQTYPKNLKRVVYELQRDTDKRVSTKTIKRLIKKTLQLETDSQVTGQIA